MRKSSILILTLIILFFLSALALSLGFMARGQITLASYYIDKYQSKQVIKISLNKAMEALDEDAKKNNYDHYSENWAINYAGLNQPKILEVNDFGNERFGSYTLAIFDEAAKININTIDAATLEKFLSQFKGIDYRKIASDIIALRQKQKGKKFYSIFQLLNLESISGEVFFAKDVNANSYLDPWEENLEIDSTEGVGELGLIQFFTVYGDGKININTVSQEILMAMPAMTEPIANDILGLGARGSIEKIEDLKSLASIDEPSFVKISNWAKVNSNFFQVRASAWVKEQSRKQEVVSIVERTLSRSEIVSWRSN